MNFFHVISKSISILFIFSLFFVTLCLLKNYLLNLKGFLNNPLFNENAILKVVKTRFRNLYEGKVINIGNKISIGNNKDNDIYLNFDVNKVINVVFYRENEDIYIKNLGNKEGVLVNNINLLNRIKLQGNEIISIYNIYFKLIIKQR